MYFGLWYNYLMTSQPEITSAYVDLDGTSVHYTEAGHGEVVLMLHGWPTSPHLYRNILPTVGETHRAIALDLPG